ncbi:SDR family oxidoreductase [Flaviramulus sp. BrNp1-15]|uniref:SDR family oxidoreductase n=1 Tax=Flaviramulus sp. BrNp1-15 TaxID=2916754 RepID=UPI001EE80343|nr:SDR family oxidoreductase [Flaviramulus sp. BrNp1-15]ULC58050.1 SDR family oxidoreductase [Flaviramulus sp. BrNp1-15]
MDLGLKNKVVIITGGTTGIGKAITRAVADEGGIPVFIGRNQENGLLLLNELKKNNKEAYYIQVDLHNTESCKKAVLETINKYGKIDALINNAGKNDSIGLENGSPDAFNVSVSNNLNHYYNMAHFCLEELKKTEGKIVNISSKTALTGQGGTSGYAAAKGAQLALTREWAVELLKYKICVNAIIPAEVMTPLYKSWLSTFENPEEKRKEITKKIPLGNRMTTKEEIASMTIFLISNKANHITGQHMFVDGGYTHLDRSIT